MYYYKQNILNNKHVYSNRNSLLSIPITPPPVTSITGFLQALQILSIFPLDPAPDSLAMSPFSGEHAEQTTLPHIRQWCFLTNAENFCLHIIHCLEAASGTHTAFWYICSDGSRSVQMKTNTFL